jgi:nucleotide-binding universal stress UspA family protein
MRAISIRSILVASDLQESSDAALHSAGQLAKRLSAELHVLHALDIPTSGYPATGVTLDFQRQIHAARRALQLQVGRALPEGVRPTTQLVRVDSPQRAINLRVAEVEAGLLVLGPHRPRAFRGPILGNTADRILRSAEVPVLIAAEPLHIPLRQVVVPIDLSDPARGALDQALLWSQALGTDAPGSNGAGPKLRVMHVIPRVYEAYDFPFDRTVIAPQLNHEIDHAIGRVGGGGEVDVREEIVWGNSPADEIIRFVETDGADLLVMGTHGYGAVGRALIGSITSIVARAAPCPMLLVPPPLWAIDSPPPMLEEELGEAARGS